MVSPAAEKFLGASSGEFLGRRITEIIPQGHPCVQCSYMEGEELSEVAAETELVTAGGFRRVGVSVQAIQEGGGRIGALGHAAPSEFIRKRRHATPGQRTPGRARPHYRRRGPPK